MKVPDPFVWLGEDARWRLFLLTVLLSMAALVALSDQGRELKTTESPWGIVSFELVGSGEGAARMLAAWGEKGRVVAGINLGLDYLFILVYAVALSLGAGIAARSHGRFSPFRQQMGILLAWGALLAGLLDVVENYALIHILQGAEVDGWAQLARWCARPKFVMVGIALAYIVSTPLVTRILARAR